MTDRIYAIGDIHGQRAKLAGAHARIAGDRRRCGDTTAPVVHVGDLVDRGPDSRGVIAFLADGTEAGAPWITLRGNHDQLFEAFLAGPDAPGVAPDRARAWLQRSMGGRETLASYGVDADGPLADIRAAARAAIPPGHRAFLAGLRPYHVAARCLFVHAGIRPGIALEDQSEDDLYWIRDDFYAETGAFPWLVVHGHTPVETVRHFGNRVDIDTGAAWDGPLSAVVIEDGEVSLLDEDGRVPVPPAP